MRTSLIRRVAPFLAAVAALALAGAPAAEALAPHAHAASFVGTYKVFVNGGGGFHEGVLTLNANGTAHDQLGTPGTWSNKGKTLTFTLTIPNIVTEVFTGKQTKKGLCSKTKTCTYTYNGAPGGIWYAIKNK